MTDQPMLPDPDQPMLPDGADLNQQVREAVAQVKDAVAKNRRQFEGAQAAAGLPVTPYDGGASSGWSGSETSHERALEQDADGTTRRRQRFTLSQLDGWRDGGLTWKELAQISGWHHGQASGVLSVLHKDGRIARLRERRNKCAVYVLPQYVDGRETAPHGRKRPGLTDEERAAAKMLAGSVEDMKMTRPVTAERIQIVLDALERLSG